MADEPIESRAEFARIPRGQHGLPPELVSADQRARLHAAIVRAVAEAGYLQVTVEQVITRAGVSRRTFYDLYDNKQDCLIAACDQVREQWMRDGSLAYTAAVADAGDDVAGRLRPALRALFDLVLSDPRGARVLFIEMLHCGSAGEQLLERTLEDLEAAVQRAFQPHEGPPSLPAAMAKVIVGGVLEVITLRLRHDQVQESRRSARPATGVDALLPLAGRRESALSRPRKAGWH